MGRTWKEMREQLGDERSGARDYRQERQTYWATHGQRQLRTQEAVELPVNEYEDAIRTAILNRR